MNDRTYQDCMEAGNNFYGKGRLLAATKEYEEAQERATTPLESAAALQMKGNVFRSLGRLNASEMALNRALRCVEDLDDVTAIDLRVRIQRDLAMTLMQDKWQSPRKLEQIFWLLNEPSDSFIKRADYWTNVGYIGRANLLYGKPREAFKKLKTANAQLQHYAREVPNDVLSNLIWLMRAAGRRRWWYLGDALRLTFSTRQYRRYLQIPLIMIGGDRFSQNGERLYQFGALVARSVRKPR